jgi:hypothetical protein
MKLNITTPQITKAEVELFNAWWMKLAPEDKKFLYEVGIVNKAFRSGLAKNVLDASPNIERAVQNLMRGLRGACDRARGQWPTNGSGRRELN